MTCKYCGNASSRRDSRGCCVSCGAPRAEDTVGNITFSGNRNIAIGISSGYNNVAIGYQAMANYQSAQQKMHPTLGESAASDSESKPAPKRVI